MKARPESGRGRKGWIGDPLESKTGRTERRERERGRETDTERVGAIPGQFGLCVFLGTVTSSGSMQLPMASVSSLGALELARETSPPPSCRHSFINTQSAPPPAKPYPGHRKATIQTEGVPVLTVLVVRRRALVV